MTPTKTPSKTATKPARKKAETAVFSGVYDRGTSFAVKVRRQDREGLLRRANQSFPYDPTNPKSREKAKDEAIAFAVAQRQALREEGTTLDNTLAAQTLAGWMRRYRDEVSTEKKGRSQEQSAFNVLLDEGREGQERAFEAVFHRPVKDYTPADFYDPQRPGTCLYSRMMKLGYAPATIKRRMMLVSHVFTQAKRWGFDLANPLAKLALPAFDNSRTRVVKKKELGDILGTANADPMILKCITFLRHTAARRSEAIRLKWSDVDFTHEFIQCTLRDTKTPKKEVRSRTIPVMGPAADVLRELCNNDPKSMSGYVFKSTRQFQRYGIDAPLHKDSITHAFARGADRSSAENVTLHDLRHTATTEITGKLSNPLDAAEITGHKDPRVLKRYYHPTAQDLAAKLADAEAAQQQKAKAKAEKAKPAPKPKKGKPDAQALAEAMKLIAAENPQLAAVIEALKKPA